MQPALSLTIPQRKKRHFIPDNLQLTSWERIKPFYENLKNRAITSPMELKKWFLDRSELESYLSEDFAWRYIWMTCNTADQSLMDALNFFIVEIQPQMTNYGNELNKKLVASPYLDQITNTASALNNTDFSTQGQASPGLLNPGLFGRGYEVLIRGIRTSIEIFREENIPLSTEMQTEERRYGAIAGAMSVEVNGEEITMQQAGDLLQSPNRQLRKEVYYKIQERRLRDKELLDNLLDKLISLRHQVALNAGFENYRDYMFVAMGRFDYTPTETFDFHQAVVEAVVPLLNQLAGQRKERLGVDALRPWDSRVDVSGLPPLKPFESSEDLLSKTIDCFTQLDPFLGECLSIMREMDYLDLESRKDKAPGGYNYPLDEIGVPFIFMNATSNLRDMVTLLHEGGHAVHSFLTRGLEVNGFKHAPSEVAELASMSMELLTMDHWNVFFENPKDLQRAKAQHLEQIIETLPWVATVDKYQHWLYEHPNHTAQERQQVWTDIFLQFSDTLTDWSGLEQFQAYIWQKQLHIYEVPFYYIEYGIAQLGAIAIWKNYKEDPEQGLQGYLDALKLGYTRPIREVYAAAGIQFDFSKAYITELMTFVKEELEKTKSEAQGSQVAG